MIAADSMATGGAAYAFDELAQADNRVSMAEPMVYDCDNTNKVAANAFKDAMIVAAEAQGKKIEVIVPK